MRASKISTVVGFGGRVRNIMIEDESNETLTAEGWVRNMMMADRTQTKGRHLMSEHDLRPPKSFAWTSHRKNPSYKSERGACRQRTHTDNTKVRQVADREHRMRSATELPGRPHTRERSCCVERAAAGIVSISSTASPSCQSCRMF